MKPANKPVVRCVFIKKELKMNIEIVSGSPRKESKSYRLAVYFQTYLQKTSSHTANIIDVREWNFPTLQEEVYSSVENTPEKYKPLAERMFAANAFIIVTPEYNGSYTPAMKNLFDHFPKQLHKPFGIATASAGVMGGMRASQQLFLLVSALFGIASPYMLITPSVDKKFDAEGQLTDPTFNNVIHTFISEFLWLGEKLSS